MNGIWALEPYHLGPWTLTADMPELFEGNAQSWLSENPTFLGHSTAWLSEGLGFRV